MVRTQSGQEFAPPATSQGSCRLDPQDFRPPLLAGPLACVVRHAELVPLPAGQAAVIERVRVPAQDHRSLAREYDVQQRCVVVVAHLVPLDVAGARG
jgi:hypothetical protein